MSQLIELIDLVTNIEIRSNYKTIPLWGKALKKGWFDAASELLRNADINSFWHNKRYGGETGLHHFAKFNDVKKVNWLLSKGANLHILDKNCWSVLHTSAVNAGIEVNTILARQDLSLLSKRIPAIELRR